MIEQLFETLKSWQLILLIFGLVIMETSILLAIINPFMTKWENKKFTEIISRDNKTSHQEHSTK